MTPIGKRLTMQQMAALAVRAEGRDPWACPKCGCKDWRVVSSFQRANGDRRRLRVCRHCGFELPTIEAPLSPDPEPPEAATPPPAGPPLPAAGSNDGLPTGIILTPDSPAEAAENGGGRSTRKRRKSPRGQPPDV